MVVGEAARLELLVEDYAGEAARGGDHAAWLERMEASALRLQKRCKRMQTCSHPHPNPNPSPSP